jgi:hypothetical protein
MESVRPVTAITGSNKFRALAEFLKFRFSDAIKRFAEPVEPRRERLLQGRRDRLRAALGTASKG